MEQSASSLEPDGGGAESFQGVLECGGRLVATVLGLVVIVVGLWCAVKVFGALFQGLTRPQAFSQIFEAWVALLGGDKLTIKIEVTEVPLAPLLASLILVAGAFLLTWLALGIMLTGAKIVSWTSGDREAVKRVLQYALGPRRH